MGRTWDLPTADLQPTYSRPTADLRPTYGRPTTDLRPTHDRPSSYFLEPFRALARAPNGEAVSCFEPHYRSPDRSRSVASVRWCSHSRRRKAAASEAVVDVERPRLTVRDSQRPRSCGRSVSHDLAVRYRGRPRGHPPVTREVARCSCTEPPCIIARRCTFRGRQVCFPARRRLLPSAVTGLRLRDDELSQGGKPAPGAPSPWVPPAETRAFRRLVLEPSDPESSVFRRDWPISRA